MFEESRILFQAITETFGDVNIEMDLKYEEVGSFQYCASKFVPYDL